MSESYTVTDFALKMGLSKTYVRHCCNGYVNPKTGRQYQLPKGYIAKKEGPGNAARRQWIIYKAAEHIEIPVDLEDDYPEALYKKRREVLLKSGTDKATAEALAKEFSWKTSYEFCRLAIATSTKGFNGIPLVKGKQVDKQTALMTLIRVLDNDLRLRRDADLISEIVTRWRYRIRRVTPDDMENQKYPFEENNYGLGQVGKALDKPEELLAKIGACYKTAVFEKKELRIELSFFPNAGWKIKLLGQGEPWLKSWLENGSESDELERMFGKTSLDALFASFWFLHMTDLKKEGVLSKKYIQESLTRPFIQNHPWKNEFLKRCLNCAERRTTTRTGAHFCVNESCRAAYWDWIKRQGKSNKTQMIKAISVKLAKIRKAIAEK